MRTTRRMRGRNAEFYVIELTPTATHPTEFHNGEELTADQRVNFRSLLYDDVVTPGVTATCELSTCKPTVGSSH
jgi:hypothetical protein